MIALVDCNNFYASCERVFRPDLEGKPVAILSNNDGCIIARSQEVKALGIPMGAPFHMHKDAIKANNVHVFSANFALYGDLSARVMSILQASCPVSEVYSIDECFLDLSGFSMPALRAYCESVRARVKKETGIPVSIGVAPTKTLAKLANHVAKKHPQSRGAWFMAGTEEGRMSHLPVDEVWGVGRRLSKSLTDMGLENVWKLREAKVGLIRKHYGVTLERTVRELNGVSCIAVDPEQSIKQRIMVSRSFGSKITDYESVHAAIAKFASMASAKLRKQQGLARSIYVFVRTNPFGNDDQYRASYRINFEQDTDDTLLITAAAMKALDNVFVMGYRYHKAGVCIDEVVPRAYSQVSLWRPPESGVSTVIDQINRRWGRETINIAASQVGKDWQMNQNRLSPRYTTCWDDLKVVR